MTEALSILKSFKILKIVKSQMLISFNNVHEIKRYHIQQGVNLSCQDFGFVIIGEELPVYSLVSLMVHMGLDEKILVLVGVSQSISLIAHSRDGLRIVSLQEVARLEVRHVDDLVLIVAIVYQQARSPDLQLAFAVKEWQQLIIVNLRF